VLNATRTLTGVVPTTVLRLLHNTSRQDKAPVWEQVHSRPNLKWRHHHRNHNHNRSDPLVITPVPPHSSHFENQIRRNSCPNALSRRSNNDLPQQAPTISMSMDDYNHLYQISCVIVHPPARHHNRADRCWSPQPKVQLCLIPNPCTQKFDQL
jgi:hypothetical protein